VAAAFLHLAQHRQQDLALLEEEDRIEVQLAHRADGTEPAVAHDVGFREHDVLQPVALRLERHAVLAEAEEALHLGRRPAAEVAVIGVAGAVERGEVLEEAIVDAHHARLEACTRRAFIGRAGSFVHS